jgi:two-component system chemotaxis response regulator CheV
MPRDTIITIVDLSKSLSLPPSQNTRSDMYIVTNFNKLNIAFHVNDVVGIQRVSWADITKPDESISNSGKGVATGIIKLSDKLIVILDFEKIVSDISPETGLKVSDIDALGERQRNTKPVLVAEDSPLLSKLILDSLHKAGYTNVIMNNNGQEAYDKLCAFRDEGTIYDKVKCVITDIEMPQMDGHRLTKLIKDDNGMKNLPVIIFSSLVNDEMRRKGESLGANAQLSKPEIGQLVTTIDKLIAE